MSRRKRQTRLTHAERGRPLWPHVAGDETANRWSDVTCLGCGHTMCSCGTVKAVSQLGRGFAASWARHVEGEKPAQADGTGGVLAANCKPALPRVATWDDVLPGAVLQLRDRCTEWFVECVTATTANLSAGGTARLLHVGDVARGGWLLIAPAYDPYTAGHEDAFNDMKATVDPLTRERDDEVASAALAHKCIVDVMYILGADKHGDPLLVTDPRTRARRVVRERDEARAEVGKIEARLFTCQSVRQRQGQDLDRLRAELERVRAEQRALCEASLAVTVCVDEAASSSPQSTAARMLSGEWDGEYRCGSAEMSKLRRIVARMLDSDNA